MEQFSLLPYDMQREIVQYNPQLLRLNTTFNKEQEVFQLHHCDYPISTGELIRYVEQGTADIIFIYTNDGFYELMGNENYYHVIEWFYDGVGGDLFNGEPWSIVKDWLLTLSDFKLDLISTAQILSYRNCNVQLKMLNDFKRHPFNITDYIYFITNIDLIENQSIDFINFRLTRLFNRNLNTSKDVMLFQHYYDTLLKWIKTL